MTPEQKIKKAIINIAIQHKDVDADIIIDDEHIDSLYENLDADGSLQYGREEFREGDFETDLEFDWSSHYESKVVAAKMDDGSWIGWTYWYGGGKHGNPQEMEWMEGAKELNYQEEEKLVVVRTFTVK